LSKSTQSNPPLKVLLAGNPNSGKTSIFNSLTGKNQHVGNYPGITVEKRWGRVSNIDQAIDLLDLPGTYSLSSYSPEERIAQDALLESDYDIVVVVVDSTNLKRSLLLLAQVMQIGARPVLCLNMSDEAERSGLQLDLPQMESLLGIRVVQTVAHRGTGIAQLIEAIQITAGSAETESKLVLGEKIDKGIKQIRKGLNIDTQARDRIDWIITRLLVGDDRILSRIDDLGLDREIAQKLAEEKRVLIEQETEQDISLFVTQQYYGFVNGLLREVVKSALKKDARALSDAIDSVVVHRFLGIPFFALIMYGIFWLTFTAGEPPMGWIESGFGYLGDWVSALWPEGTDSPLRSLLVDGLIAGVGGVVVFLPNILLLFLGLVILEDTGYMARAAFLVDRVMHRFGLHGKSFVPMMTGFGCSIPGIMATRTLENERDRLATMLVLPFMSCGARLTIWMLLIPAFFSPSMRAPMLGIIYLVGIVIALLVALLLRKTILVGDDAPFVMELPPYRLPTMKGVLMRIFGRAGIYLRKAGTIILCISILLWVIAAYPKKSVFEIDELVASGVVQLTDSEVEVIRASEALEYSISGRIGRAIEPLIQPLGFDWRLGTAMIGAFAAKEVFVAQMGIVYAVGEADENSEDLRDRLANDYTPLVGLSLMLFLLISTPCMATIAVTRRESGSWKWALLQLGGMTGLGYLVSLVVYQVGRLIV
jgi:ferrous iron transport protein B